MSRLSALGHHSVTLRPLSVMPPCMTGHFAMSLPSMLSSASGFGFVRRQRLWARFRRVWNCSNKIFGLVKILFSDDFDNLRLSFRFSAADLGAEHPRHD